MSAGASQPDHVANRRIYGREVPPADILNGRVPPPPAPAFRAFRQLVNDLVALEALAADGSAPPPCPPRYAALFVRRACTMQPFMGQVNIFTDVAHPFMACFDLSDAPV